ncbi:hypothetical protein [Methylocaldum sp.]|uniref:hypothetical protein n=1 Tax=Methylocaldum sp. TaxID=1969727 RepID=UPI002D28AB04|nr:hypothetical protein [Methylocaldum sp.]HYE34010.1 hypothetical protein [Methylocaldum sp.]
MALVKCPECAAQIPDQTDTCPSCGWSEKPAHPVETAPIYRLSGKLKATGTVLVAASILAIIAGAWWGAALLFPGAAFFILGWFL